MRYKIVKMNEAQIKNYHPCELCECAQGAFCQYPAECPAGDTEFIKKVYR
jgi:hypothetical protein